MQAKSSARARTPLFEGLPAAALDEIYRQMAPRHFAAREVICREGEPGDSLFVIQGGLAQVGVGGTVIARLRRGDVVGEQSLITGEPRSATVVAQTKLEVVVIAKTALERPIMGNPLLAERIGTVLAERKSEMEAIQENLGQRAEPREGVEHRRKTLGSRIRRFFGATAY